MRSPALRIAALLVVLAPSIASATTGAGRLARPAVRRTSGMVRIPSGEYGPLYAVRGVPRVRVSTFALDRQPVTRLEFLAFVRSHPEWRRGTVRPELAESGYLADWPAALDVGPGDDARRPVTGVSWFAAKAFCAAQGKRLPTLHEWEYVASASATRRDASADPGFRRQLLALYAARVPARLPVAGSGVANVYGVRNLHDSAWEWTLDYDAVTGHVPGIHGGHHAIGHPGYCASAAIGVTDPADYPAFLRFAVRASLSDRATMGSLGFRCAADLLI
jgi:formylglycine-generating enzyme required for sulfatase activity